MKKICQSAILFLVAVMLTYEANSQDIIYRTNGISQFIKIVSFDGKTVKYRLPDDTAGKLYYLSITVLDSLRYDNGESVSFNNTITPSNLIKRNYIGTDIFNDCFQNLNLSFERLSASGITSFSGELMINLNIDNFYGVQSYWRFLDNIYFNYDPFYFFVKGGFYYYPFNYSLKRTGAVRSYIGASLLLGQFKKEEYNEITYNYEYKAHFAAVVSWNVGIKIYLDDWLQIRTGIEISLLPFLVFNSPEAGIMISF